MDYYPEFYFDSVDLGLKALTYVKISHGFDILWYSDGYTSRVDDSVAIYTPTSAGTGKGVYDGNSTVYATGAGQCWKAYDYNSDYGYHSMGFGATISKGSTGTYWVRPTLSLCPNWENYDKTNYGYVALRICAYPGDRWYITAYGYE